MQSNTFFWLFSYLGQTLCSDYCRKKPLIHNNFHVQNEKLLKRLYGNFVKNEHDCFAYDKSFRENVTLQNFYETWNSFDLKNYLITYYWEPINQTKTQTLKENADNKIFYKLIIRYPDIKAANNATLSEENFQWACRNILPRNKENNQKNTKFLNSRLVNIVNDKQAKLVHELCKNVTAGCFIRLSRNYQEVKYGSDFYQKNLRKGNVFISHQGKLKIVPKVFKNSGNTRMVMNYSVCQSEPLICIQSSLHQNKSLYHLDKSGADFNLCLPNVCVCENGVVVDDQECFEHNSEMDCKSCNTGYHLNYSDKKCYPNVCVCEHGEPVDPGSVSCRVDGDNICQTCDDGFWLDSESKKCSENICDCSNGIASTGTDCPTHGQNYCQSCSTYYHKNAGSKICEQNSCNCQNGSPVSYSSCLSHGSEKCYTCNSGYHKNGDICQQNVCECDNGVPVDSGSSACTSHEANICESCDDGYYLYHYSSRCYLKICKCPNGSESRGTDCPSNYDTHCQSCNSFYNLDPATNTCKRNSCICNAADSAPVSYEFCATNGAHECYSCSNFTLEPNSINKNNFECHWKRCSCMNGTPLTGDSCSAAINCSPIESVDEPGELVSCSCQDNSSQAVGSCLYPKSNSNDPYPYAREGCESCDLGYHLTTNHTCEPNVCTCENGNAVSPGSSLCYQDGKNSCNSCDSGYFSDWVSGERSHWTCSLKTCTCENGSGSTGENCRIDGEPDCGECNFGYQLQVHFNQSTLIEEGKCHKINICTCENGIGSTGENCRLDGTPDCAECDFGYHHHVQDISSQLTLSNPRFGDNLYYMQKKPEYAIDGDKTPSSSDFIAHSRFDNDPTFIVDLPNFQTIVEKIVIYPRQDGLFSRYTQMAVKIDNNYCQTDQSLDKETIKANKKTGIIFQCENLMGSKIIVENGNHHLQIAEIEAFTNLTKEGRCHTNYCNCPNGEAIPYQGQTLCYENNGHHCQSCHDDYWLLAQATILSSNIDRCYFKKFLNERNGVELNLAGQDIENLKPYTFNSISQQVKALTLKNNKLQAIPQGLFHYTVALEILNLSGNQIKTLDKYAFANIDELIELSLKDNQLESIQPELFQQNRQLKRLSLSGNQIKTLPHITFETLLDLETLWISDNLIESVPGNLLQFNAKLEKFSLAGNKITQLSENFFQNNVELKELSLSRNSMQQLDANLFEPITKLEKLYLYYNFISEFPVNIFENPLDGWTGTDNDKGSREANIEYWIKDQL